VVSASLSTNVAASKVVVAPTINDHASPSNRTRNLIMCRCACIAGVDVHISRGVVSQKSGREWANRVAGVGLTLGERKGKKESWVSSGFGPWPL
jgi:hypothetical protein